MNQKSNFQIFEATNYCPTTKYIKKTDASTQTTSLTNTIPGPAAEGHERRRVGQVEPLRQEPVRVKVLGVWAPVVGVAVDAPDRDHHPGPGGEDAP